MPEQESLKHYRADLHIHSCLSPCASLDMSPRAIAQTAVEKGLNCIALTDHNSAGNCAVMQTLCSEKGILFFPGIEVSTSEEAHILCLFETVKAAEHLGEFVYRSLPDVDNEPEKLGDQVLVNETDEIEGFVQKYLGLASMITIDQLRSKVRELGGLLIPAHIDRPSFSVISQLGFLSGDFSAVEISRAGVRRGIDLTLAGPYPAVTASDSHYLHEIGSVSVGFELREGTFEEYCFRLSQKNITIYSRTPDQSSDRFR
ncbi:MAG: PHP domain-containing protein [Chitinispirillaceae bacterium]